MNRYRLIRFTMSGETCGICGEPFASPSELVIHMREAHKDAPASADLDMNPEAHRPGLVCALCGRRFATPQALAAHNLRPHPELDHPRSSRRAPAEPSFA
jgi:hypothetical protein